MRTPHGEFPGYHTSADGLDRIRPESLARGGGHAASTRRGAGEQPPLPQPSPYGEPQLGRRGLYRSAGGAVATPEDERALLWVLNQSDGNATLLDVAGRSGLRYPVIQRAAERLEQAGLLAEALSA